MWLLHWPSTWDTKVKTTFVNDFESLRMDKQRSWTPTTFAEAWEDLKARTEERVGAILSGDVPGSSTLGIGIAATIPGLGTPTVQRMWSNLPDHLPRHPCLLCQFAASTEDLWKQHVIDQHCAGRRDAWESTYRKQVLCNNVASFPRAISPQEVRHSLARYKDATTGELNRRLRVKQDPPLPSPLHEGVCAVCAQRVLSSTMKVLRFSITREQLTDHQRQLATILSARAYWERHKPSDDEELPDDFLGLELQTLNSTGVPAPFTEQENDFWLLHLNQKEREKWIATVENADENSHCECSACAACSHDLGGQRGVKATMPKAALANDLWSGPTPDALKDLTLAERLFVSRAITYTNLKTMKQKAAPEARQLGMRGNAISFPHEPHQVLAGLPCSRLPRSAALVADYLVVYFTGPSADIIDTMPEYRVRQWKVREDHARKTASLSLPLCNKCTYVHNM